MKIIIIIIPSVANAAHTVKAVISALLSLPLVLLWESTTGLFTDKVGETVEVCFSSFVSNRVGSLVIGLLCFAGKVVDTFSPTASAVLDGFDSLRQGVERTLHFFSEFAHSSATSSLSSLQHSVQRSHPKINGTL